ncbi:MAG: hypothetical protein ACON4Z_07440 [Planctomycetota bacterium]
MSNDARSAGVLLLRDDPRTTEGLKTALEREAVPVDVATALADARATFYRAGGHGCLVIGPDVTPGVARQVATALRGLDPQLAVATFGPALRHLGGRRVAHLQAYHPGSRAGQGALLRFLVTL